MDEQKKLTRAKKHFPDQKEHFPEQKQRNEHRNTSRTPKKHFPEQKGKNEAKNNISETEETLPGTKKHCPEQKNTSQDKTTLPERKKFPLFRIHLFSRGSVCFDLRNVLFAPRNVLLLGEMCLFAPGIVFARGNVFFLLRDVFLCSGEGVFSQDVSFAPEKIFLCPLLREVFCVARWSVFVVPDVFFAPRSVCLLGEMFFLLMDVFRFARGTVLLLLGKMCFSSWKEILAM